MKHWKGSIYKSS